MDMILLSKIYYLVWVCQKCVIFWINHICNVKQNLISKFSQQCVSIT